MSDIETITEQMLISKVVMFIPKASLTLIQCVKEKFIQIQRLKIKSHLMKMITLIVMK